MFECELPFDHKTLHLELEDKNFAGVMEGHQNEFKTTKSQEELVEESLANPYGSPSLEELCAGKKDIVIISSDHTRPVPSRVTMPILLHHIHSAAPEARVRILVATGMHRPSTHEELVNKYGEEIVANEEIVMHVATDDSMMKKIGTLPSGGECIINKIAADCDLLLAEGFIEPHFFAGFSGSRKSVLPGIASYKTIMYNHNGQFVNDSHSRAGNLCHNHVSEDMFAAAEMAHLAFVLNVVLNGKHEVIGSFAGDIHKAHEAGCEFVKSLAGVEPVECEIAITTNGGYPLDQNIYQSVKGMTAAEVTVKEGGVIIMLSKAADGHGGKYFHETFRDEKDLNRMMKTFMDRKPEETIIDQWQSQIFARVMLKARIVFVSSCDDKLVEELHMIPAHSMEEALEKAKAMVNKEDYKVTVIPDGVSVIVRE